MKFELKGIDAHILHVMTAKPNAEAAIYQSVKIGCDQVPESAIAALIGAKTVGEFKQAFMVDGKPRFGKITEIPINREYLAKHMVTFGDLKPKRVSKLWKISVSQLSEGSFGLNFSMQIDPNDPVFAWEMHNLHHQLITLELEQDGRELLDEDKEAAPVKTTRAPKNDHLAQAAAGLSATH